LRVSGEGVFFLWGFFLGFVPKLVGLVGGIYLFSIFLSFAPPDFTADSATPWGLGNSPLSGVTEFFGHRSLVEENNRNSVFFFVLPQLLKHCGGGDLRYLNIILRVVFLSYGAGSGNGPLLTCGFFFGGPTFD